MITNQTDRINSIVDNLTNILNAEIAIQSGILSDDSVYRIERELFGWKNSIGNLVRYYNEANKSQPQPTPYVAPKWHNDPASTAQYNYLRSMGVDVAGAKLTKIQASRAIDMVKSGNGIGSMNLFFNDGSN